MITAQAQETLRRALLAGGWWDWPDDAHEPQFFPLSQWKARYRAIREGAA